MQIQRRAFIYRNAHMYRVSVKGFPPRIIIVYTYQAIKAEKRSF